MQDSKINSKTVDTKAARLAEVASALVECMQKGIKNPQLEKEFKELLKEQKEQIRAILWDSDLSAIQEALELKLNRDKAIKAAIKRPDLTTAEWLQLHKAIREDLMKLNKSLRLALINSPK